MMGPARRRWKARAPRLPTMDAQLSPLDFAPAGPEPDRAPRALRARGPARLWLLRHGAVEAPAGAASYGQRDVPLSAEGARETDRVARSLARHDPPSLVVASTLARARAMGEAVAEECGAPLRLDARLVEVDRGAWTGLGADEYMGRWRAEADAYWRDPLGWRGHGGESESDLVARGFAAVEEALDAAPDGSAPVAVCAHRQLLRAFVAAALGVPVGRSHALVLPTGTGVLLEVGREGEVRLLRTAAPRPGAPQIAEPADGPPEDVPTTREALERGRG